MTPASRRLLRRYGIPGALLALGYVPWLLPFAIVTAPVASLWIFWLILREPRVDKFTEKLPRLAVITGLTAVPVALAAYFIPKSDDVAVILVPFIFFPALIVLLGGLVAVVTLIFQPREADENAGD